MTAPASTAAFAPTPEQALAVNAPGSVAIDAGAGSGKTRVLAERTLRLLSEGLHPSELLAVTFTEAAAAELRERIERHVRAQIDAKDARADWEAIEDALPLAQISTIHALCARVAREHPVESGAGLGFEVLDERGEAAWTAAHLSAVLAELPPETFADLGVALVREATLALLRDPLEAGRAFDAMADGFEARLADAEAALARAREEARREWHAAAADLHAAQASDPNDPLELARRAALHALATAPDDEAARLAVRSALAGVRSNAGSAKNWPGGKAVVGAAVNALKRLAEGEDRALTGAVWQLRAAAPLRRAFEHVLQRFDALRAEREQLTFNDLERLAARALSHETVRDHYARRWRAVLVDEFQDTNPVQWRVLSALLHDRVNLTVVGDEKQSIYAFRRADVRLFRAARHLVEERGGQGAALRRSFRTHAGLVRVANAFFEGYMPGPGPGRETAAAFAPLVAAREENPAPGFDPCELHVLHGSESAGELRDAEARWLAHRVRALVEDGRLVHAEGAARPARFGDMAVLFRARTDLPRYEAALFRAGVPYVVDGGRGLLDRPEVRDAVQLLRWLDRPAADLALAAVLRSPYFHLSDEALYRLAKDRGDATLWSALESAGSEFAVPRAVLRALLESRASAAPARLLSMAARLTDHSVVMAAMPDGERRLANLAEFTRVLHAWQTEGHHDVTSVAERLRELERLEAGLPEATLAGEDAVRLMTIHGSKGLEFPVVFLPDLGRAPRGDTAPVLFDPEVGVAVRVPGVEAAEQPILWQRLATLKAEREAAEAERVMYVAMTRAADLLVLSAAVKPDSEGGMRVARLAGLLPAEGVSRWRYLTAEIPDVDRRAMERRGRVDAARRTWNVALPESLPVTSLGVYLACPRQFAERYLAGRPGVVRLWQGDAPERGDERGVSGAVIGSAVHAAIEKGWKRADLERELDHLSPAERDEVWRLASNLAKDVYAELRSGPVAREQKITFGVRGLVFEGVVDALYPAWVVDYKTDRSVYPEHHLPQLALYARELGAERASLVYLRHDRLHDFTPEDLARGVALAESAVAHVEAGDFAPTPSPHACRFCAYRGVCDAAASDR